MSTFQQYNYFDTPDGEDIDKKLWFVLKPVGLSALLAATVDVMANTKPKGYLQILRRYAYITLPVVGAAAAFVITTNLAAKYRETDDKLNWFAGGVAAGITIGAWQRSVPTGFAACAFMAALAVTKKYTKENGMMFMVPDEFTKQGFGGLHASRYDWTLLAERPRGWAIAPPQAPQPPESPQSPQPPEPPESPQEN